VRDLKRHEASIKELEKELRATVSASGTTLTQIQGIGFLTAAKILALTGDIRRFPNQEHYASYAGTAPIDVSSGDQETHRLSRRGNRQLNAAIHVAAVTQARDPGPGRDHYRRKLTEHKTPKEARRSLKRRLSNTIYRRILADHQRPDSRRLTHRGALEPLPALGRRPELRRPKESHTTQRGQPQ
jgi:transposase